MAINFGEHVLKAGIHRVVNGLPDDIDFNAKTQRRNSGEGSSLPLEDQDGQRLRLVRVQRNGILFAFQSDFATLAADL